MNHLKSEPSILDHAINNQEGESNISLETLKEVLANKPDLLKKLNEMVEAVQTRKQLSEAIDDLNKNWSIKGERHGMYSIIHFELPSGQTFRVKIFKDMENALSFTTE